jgi:oligopeptide transport system substrate-binding protein
VGIRAADDFTLVITLRHPAAYFLGMLNHESWYPVHLPTLLKYGKIDDRTTAWTHAGNLVGNGPFRLKAWRSQQEVVVERNPFYWAAKSVRLNEIHYYPTENIDTEERDFRAGLLHLTYEVPQTKVDVYRRERSPFLQISPYFGCYFYRFNVTHPALRDRRVRRALAMAIDRDGIVRNVTRGGQQPAHTLTPAGTAGYECTGGIPTDYEGARRLLAEAGHPNGAGLPTIDLLINTSQNHREVAEVIQETWKRELHLDARIVSEEWKVYLDSQKTLNYTTSRTAWIGDYLDPYSFLGLMVTDNGNNDTGFSNPEYDRLIDRSRQIADPGERRAVLQQAETLLLDEAPIAPVYFYTRVYLKQPSVKGWYNNFLDRHMPRFIYLDDSSPMQFIPGQTKALSARGR